ncbi:AGAP008472-PA-like protein [Anopheles sinensis]|uniref:eEF1A lysine and N-terminal methyltransferase homolog n=1 Tax=Anopheles sinensis TaxID=74873 RepID=A0A084VL35_ANOSI|nr:AGAP008472-PA-like protein [Anopheles sinensis]
MNLLPKSTADFGSTEYWNSFFRKRGKQAFEWYGEYPELCGQLHKYIKPKDEILVVGCGNSKLSVDLYDVGFKKITNIDISPVVIKQMQEANRTQRPEMTWCQMDATAMTLPDESFSVVLDKGTLDALFTDQSEEVVGTVRRYFQEIGRVLRSGGRYVCISLLQEHILREVVEHFPSHHFMLRIVRCPDAGGRGTSEAAAADGSSLVVFAIVATKFKNLPMRVLELCMAGDQMERVQQPEDMIGAVAAAQKAAMYRRDGRSIDRSVPSERKQTPRYTIHVLDQAPKRGSGKYAAFIVPQGRETEWLFATPQGRQKLQASANFDRLAVVTLHRGHVYTDLEAVKVELAESVKSLAPSGLQGASIPYLSIGAEVGRRETIHTGRSEHSGEYVVEEIVGDNGRTFRRLIFLATPAVVQSEAALKMARVRGSRAPQKVVDPGYLACQHHLFMTVGVQLATRLTQKTTSPPSSLSSSAAASVAVIGLGGGGLCTFIRECLKASTITAVEIDPEIERIAVKYFGLTLDNRLRVVIEDGIRFLAEEANRGAHYSAVLFDVDSKDPTVGMSCPPAIFVERNVLAHVRKLVGDEGLFVLNLVCRNDALRETTVRSLRESFKYVLSYKLEEDVNEVFYCTDNEGLKDATNWQKELREAANDVNKLARKEKLTHEQELVDLSDFVSALQI